MTDNVVSLGEAAITSDRRQQFMQDVAHSWEVYVATYDREPEALVYLLCGLKQPSVVAWHIEGESADGVASVLSLAAVHLITEAGNTRQGLD